MPDELNHPPAPPLWRVKTPGLAEFNMLFSLLPYPTLIVDRTRDTVIFANLELLKTTAFSRTEIIGASINHLIPGLELAQLSDGDELALSIKRRTRDPLEVTVKVNALDYSNQWIGLQLLSKNLNQKESIKRMSAAVRSILDLVQASDEPDLPFVLDRAVSLCASLLNCSMVGIYRASAEFPRLERTACNAEAARTLPETIPSSDLIRLSETSFWVPGKRVQTEVHRYARIAGVSYIVTTPLGFGKGLFGLLVIGDTQAIQPESVEMLQETLKLLGSGISMELQYFLLSENLRQQLQNYQDAVTSSLAVFENSKEGIIVLSPDLLIQKINQAAEWMLGYADWEVRGQPVDNILIGTDRIMPALESAQQGIPTHNLGAIQLHRRNGQAFPADLQTIPVFKETAFLGVVIFLTDASANEEIRQRSQQLEHRAVLGDVTAVFAHEVRNPINNISTGVQLITSRMDDADPNKDVLLRMEADCARLNHLMESVLAFSRPAEHKSETINLVFLLQRLLDRWRPRLAKVNVEAFFQAANNISKVSGDPRALEQVFTNLISNAVEAMSNTGGTLAVKIAPAEIAMPIPQVQVIISDNGPGIPDDIRERIFEPFVTNKRNGTGLGLAITKRIITAHHGSITLDTFPGGTVFHVSLPAFEGE